MSTSTRLPKIIFYASLCGACSVLAFVAGRYTAKPVELSAAVGSNSKTKSTAANASAVDLAASLARKNVTMDSLLKSPGTPDAEQLALWAAGLSPQDCAAALAQLQAMPTGVQRDALLKAVINAWAKHDPAGFLAATSQVTNPRFRENGITDALRGLAAQDPQAALDWLKQNPGAGSAAVMENRFNAAITGYAANDPTGAFNYVDAMSDGSKQDSKLKKDAFDALAEGMAQQGKFADAVSLFNQLPDGNVRNDAFGSLINRWGAAAPQDAANWIANNAPPAVASDYNETLVGSWVNSDPVAAANYAVQAEQQLLDQGTLGGSNNTDTLPNTISSWAKYDLNAAGQFIDQLPASAVKDRAISSFISTASKVDPAGAIAWTSAVSDPQQSQKLMLQVAKQWQTSDPNAYNQYLATTTTLTDQQMQLLANLPPPAPATKKGNAQSTN